MLTQNQLEVLGAAYEAIAEICDYGKANGVTMLGHISIESGAWVSCNGPACFKINNPFLSSLLNKSVESVKAWKGAAIHDIQECIKQYNEERIAALEKELDILRRAK